MERFVLPVWDLAVSVIRRKSEASSEALEAPSIMRTHLGGEVHQGKIVQQGTHAELLSQEGIYRNFIQERREAAGWKIKEAV